MNRINSVKTLFQKSVLFVVLVLGAIPSSAQSPLVKLTLHTEQPTYALGEKIPVTLTFHNQVDRPVLLRFDRPGYHAFFRFDISRDGERLEAYRMADLHDMTFPIDEKLLYPNAPYTMHLFIDQLNWVKGSPFDEAGEYEVRMTYFGISSDAQDILHSNPVTFQIRENEKV